MTRPDSPEVVFLTEIFMLTAPPLEKHDLRAWAAYTGHHVTYLRFHQFISHWVDGQSDVPKGLPPEEKELQRALEILAEALSMGYWRKRKLRTCLQGALVAVERWIHERALGCVYWDREEIPGEKDWHAVRRILKRSFRQYPLLLQWYMLGERLAEEDNWSGRMPDDTKNYLSQTMGWLHGMGQYPFLQPLLTIFHAPTPEDVVPEDLRHLIDPTLGVVRIARLEKHLRECLAKGAAPVPVIVFGDDGVRYFGRQFAAGEFRDDEWRLFRYFCRNAMKDLPAARIISRAGLACSLRRLPIHVGRLKHKLWPAVEAYFASGELPAYAHDSFIVNWNRGLYEFAIPSESIRIERSERFKFFWPKSRFRHSASNASVQL